MASMPHSLVRTVVHRWHVDPISVLVILAALMSLLTFTVVLPSGLHLP